MLLAVVAIALGYGIVRRAQVRWAFERAREPYVRPLEEEPGFDEAVEALAECPAALRTRFALSWVWGAVAWAIVGGTFAFSTAYFLVDAVLARGRVGWQQPVYAVVFALLSLAVFAATAGRLATWRFAASVHKEVATGYPETG